MLTSTVSRSSHHQNRLRLLTLLGLLAGFALRLVQLGAESLWYDETVSVYLARLPLAAMIRHTAGDIHPPGYYALLHGWQAIATPSLVHGLEFLFAWPSLWCGVLILPLVYVIARHLFGTPTAVVALWLTALNPFQLWYSQEVRMYTVGALLGLLCVWAMLRFVDPRTDAASAYPLRWLVVYAMAAAAGLYTLYYFVFLLAAINLLAILWIWLAEPGEERPRARRTWQWLAAQAAVLVLWLPWLPVFLRQATDPPVPPWRTPWDSLAAFGASLGETLSALLVGQTPPGGLSVLWAVVTVLMLAGIVARAVAAARRRPTATARRRLWLALTAVLIPVFVPIALLYGITLLLTPIYHVRYLFIYAPLFLVAVAWLIVGAYRLRKWLGVALGAVLAATFAVSLVLFWTAPAYRADDHRAAVAQLAQRWRPGDVILANAGWVYPILATYWPTETTAPTDSLPPPISRYLRLTDYTKALDASALDQPLVLRTGSVDGSPRLGWGDPNSDFYAMPQADALASLDAIAQHASRLWHYRLYDTVSDPQGDLRAWLDSHASKLDERQIPGRDYGMVQLYALPGEKPSALPTNAPVIRFGNALAVQQVRRATAVAPGAYYYVTLNWLADQGLTAQPAPLSMSLRLYDGSGAMVAQADSPPDTATNTWRPGEQHLQVLAVPVPGNLPPGNYTAELIVYPQDGGSPLAPSPADASPDGQRWRIGPVQVEPAAAR